MRYYIDTHTHIHLWNLIDTRSLSLPILSMVIPYPGYPGVPYPGILDPSALCDPTCDTRPLERRTSPAADCGRQRESG